VLDTQPRVMRLRPRMAVGVEASLPQSKFRYAMPGHHQDASAILAGPHQIAGCFPFDAGYSDADDPPEVKSRSSVARRVCRS